MQKGKEGGKEVKFAPPDTVTQVYKDQEGCVGNTGREEPEGLGKSTARLAGSGPKSARGISSPPEDRPPNSFPPSGHSSGADSVPRPCPGQEGGWELQRQPQGTALSLSWSFLLPQIYSWTGPLRRHPKVRGTGGLPQPSACICPLLPPCLALELPSWLSST